MRRIGGTPGDGALAEPFQLLILGSRRLSRFQRGGRRLTQLNFPQIKCKWEIRIALDRLRLHWAGRVADAEKARQTAGLGFVGVYRERSVT